jgi:quinoprotein glucose dehydrogenase
MFQAVRRRPVITGSVVLLLGIALAGGGVWLIALGGSWYYALAGAGLVIAGALVARGRREGLWLYGLVLAATIVWAVWEVGLDGWRLMPRLFAPAVLGAWLCMPWVAGKLTTRQGAGGGRALPLLGAVACLALAIGTVGLGVRTTQELTIQAGEIPAASPASPGDPAQPDGEWRYYGRTAQGTRFSPLGQITPANAGKLELAWTFHTGDLPRPGENSHGREFNLEVTPIEVGDSVYVCTPHRSVIALDAASGKQRWRFDPDNDTAKNIYLACRGVAYYEAPGGTACPRRIISTTADARLFALDAETGKLCPDFGEDGYVSLRQGLSETPPGFHFITSQPMVLRDRIMLSGWVYDNQTEGEPSGVIRAFDARTGALSWAWDMGRADPTSPLKPGETYTPGTPNGWGAYTADPALNLVYVPLGNATPDYFGAQRRPYDDEYGATLVALDAESGKERWHFQTVHHDVWDFDLPVGPTLVDLPDGKGGSTPALVQTTKHGQLFLLDRRDGKPIAEVAEKPVPQNGLEGERLSPTQPFSVGMPALTPPNLTERDAWGATPIDQLACRIDFRRARYDGPFTPPTLKVGIAYPAFDGVVDWHGATLDPARRLLIANTSYIPFTVQAYKHDDAVKSGLIYPWKGWGSGEPYPQPPEFANGPQYGTPYAAVVKPWLNFLNAPCSAPPWGKLVAIDLVSRKVVWERVVGTTRDMGLFGAHTNVPLPTGMFNIGGNIVTAGGVIFAGAYADDYIRAFDERSGAELWRARLPAGGQATPSTYEAGRRQYVVIAAGGHGGLQTRNGDAIMAYALPKS